MRRILTIAMLLTSCTMSADARPRPGQHRPPRAMRMLATAYCDHGRTKSGVRAQPGVVAADVRQLPLGTRVRVLAPGQPYAGVYTVLDTGSKIKGRDLDIFMPSCRAARRFGKRPVHVQLLEIRKNRRDRGDH